MEGYESNIKKKRDDLLRAIGSTPEVSPLIPEKEEIANVENVEPISEINEQTVETPIQPSNLSNEESIPKKNIQFKINLTPLKTLFLGITSSIKDRFENIFNNRLKLKKVAIILPISLIVIFLGFNIFRFITEPSEKPENVRISNVTDTSFTVSWTTKNTPTIGGVIVQDTNTFLPVLSQYFNTTFNDERELKVEQTRLYTHFVSVNKLNPSTKYFIRLLSGNIQYEITDYVAENKVITTSNLSDIPSPIPVYGSIVTNNQVTPQAGALVYARLENAGKYSSLVSSFTDENGRYQFDVSTLRDSDGEIFRSNDKSKIRFEVDAGNRGKAVFSTGLTETQPTAQINLKDTKTDNTEASIFSQYLDYYLSPIATDLEGLISPVSANSINTNTIKGEYVFPEIRILNILIPFMFLFLLVVFAKQLFIGLNKRKFFHILAVLIILIHPLVPLTNFNSLTSDQKVDLSIKGILKPIYVSVINSGLFLQPNVVSARETDDDGGGTYTPPPTYDPTPTPEPVQSSTSTPESVPEPQQCGDCNDSCFRGYTNCGQYCGGQDKDAPGKCGNPGVTKQCNNGEHKCDGNVYVTCNNDRWTEHEYCASTQQCKTGSGCVGKEISCDTSETPIGCSNDGSGMRYSTQELNPSGNCQVKIITKEDSNCNSDNGNNKSEAPKTPCDGKCTTNEICDSNTNTCRNKDNGNDACNGLSQFPVEYGGSKRGSWGYCCPSGTSVKENSNGFSECIGGGNDKCSEITIASECSASPVFKGQRQFLRVDKFCKQTSFLKEDPSCKNSSYAPETSEEAIARLRSAEEAAAKAAKAGKAMLDKIKDEYLKTFTGGICQGSDMGKAFKDGNKCLRCINMYNPPSEISCDDSKLVVEGITSNSSLCSTANYSFKVNDQCFMCGSKNSNPVSIKCEDAASLMANEKALDEKKKAAETARLIALNETPEISDTLYTSTVTCDETGCSSPLAPKSLGDSCKSSNECGENICVHDKRSEERGDKAVNKCKKTVEKAMKDEIAEATNSGSGKKITEVINKYLNGTAGDYAKDEQCDPDPKTGVKDCDKNGIPDVVELAYGANPGIKVKDYESLMKTVYDSVRTSCEGKISTEGGYNGIPSGTTALVVCQNDALKNFDNDLLTNGMPSKLSQILVKKQLEDLLKSEKRDIGSCFNDNSLQNGSSGKSATQVQNDCKAIFANLDKTCANEGSKTGNFADIKADSGGCFKNLASDLFGGIGTLVKAGFNDTKEQREKALDCDTLKKTTGIDCSISENFTAKSDPYTLIQNGASSITDRLSKQSPEDIKSFCETQQQKGFAKGIDCQTISVKGNSKILNASEEFRDLMTGIVGSTNNMYTKESLDFYLGKLSTIYAGTALDTDLVKQFYNSTDPEEQKRIHDKLFKEFMVNKGGDSETTDFLLSSLNYVDCITNSNTKNRSSSCGSYSPKDEELNASTSAKDSTSSYNLLVGQASYFATIDAVTAGVAGAELLVRSGIKVGGAELSSGAYKTLNKEISDLAFERASEKGFSKEAVEYAINNLDPEQLVKKGIVENINDAKALKNMLTGDIGGYLDDSAIYKVTEKIESLAKNRNVTIDSENLQPGDYIITEDGIIIHQSASSIGDISTNSDSRHLALSILGKLDDFPQVGANGRPTGINSMRDLRYDLLVNDVKDAVRTTKERLAAGENLGALGFTVNPIDPRTGKNVAKEFYEELGFWDKLKNKITRKKPEKYVNDIRDFNIAFVENSDLAIQEELDQIALREGVDPGTLEFAKRFFSENKAGGFVTGWDDYKTAYMNLGHGDWGVNNGTLDAMLKTLCHEACHTGMQRTSYSSIKNEYGQDWYKAVGSLTEAMTDVGGAIISDNARLANVSSLSQSFLQEKSAYNGVLRNLNSLKVDMARRINADLIRTGADPQSIYYNERLVNHIMFLAMTDPVRATKELVNIYGEKGYDEVLKMIGGSVVRGVVDQKVQGVSVDSSGKVEKEFYALTDSDGVLDVDTCTSNKVSIGESFQVYNHCANRAQLRLKVKQTDKIDYSKLKIIDSLDNKEIGNGNSEFFVSVNKDSPKSLIFKYTNDKGVSVNLGGIAVSILKLDQEYVVPLNVGWQTFSPVFDPGDYKASDMLKDISSQGGYVTAISTYQEGAWQTYKVRGDQNYGTDFKIEQGKGYFLLVKTPLNYIFSGIPSSDSKSIKLNNGWNLVGLTPGFSKDKDGNWQFGKNDFKYQNEEANKVVDSKLKVETDTKGYTAKKLLELLKQKSIQANIVTKWEDGRYNNFIVESDTSDQSKFIEYGFDFYLYPNEAYFVRVTKSNGAISP